MDNVFIYGLYILIWPAITLGVLVLICTATYRDVKKVLQLIVTSKKPNAITKTSYRQIIRQ
ncbi:hypothetical protein, partial [Psychrobacter sp. ENNN9_III]|uniref:hypothetical protein n=1 Tax=Psychrobacter sp. ENNN9_III TaxID=1254334 RepID=UPI00071E84BB